MQPSVRAWGKYLCILSIFGIGINLIYLALPIFFMVNLDRVLHSYSIASLVTLTLGILISLLAMGIIDYCRRFILLKIGNQYSVKISPCIFKYIYRTKVPGEKIQYTRGIEDLEQVKRSIFEGHIIPFLDFPWIILYAALLFLIDPIVGAISVLIIFLSSVILALLLIYAQKRVIVHDFMQNSIVKDNQLSGKIPKIIDSIISRDYLRSRLDGNLQKSNVIFKEIFTVDAAVSAFFYSFFPLSMAIVLAAGSLAFFSNDATIGSIIAAPLLLQRILGPFSSILQNFKEIIKTTAALKRINARIPQDGDAQKISLPPLNGQIAIESLTINLGGKAILRNISFSLESGESLGIIGPSSSGKSSLCEALLGILPANVGSVRLDGAEIFQWNEDELYKQVGYLPQNPQLFEATVAENIARMQTVESEKVVEAAQKAGVHEIIMKLPEGYDTQVVEWGCNLSASQRQQIAFARALYDSPQFIVLDTPHAYLDEAGLLAVAKGIQAMKVEGRTSVTVTDRPQLLAAMDKLIVIREGRVVMFGPAKEVLTKLINKQQPSQQATA